MKLVNKIKITKAIIFYHLFRTKKPIYVDIKLTNRCNLNCQYCISTKFKNQELTKKEIFSLLTTLKKIGTIVVNFSGGEVLLRDDIDEIVKGCLKHKAKNDWFIQKTKKKETFYKIAEVLKEYSKFFDVEAKKHKIRSVNIDNNFLKQVNKTVSNLYRL